MTDKYLEIAQLVLAVASAPLTTREILAHAYRVGLVPHNLHGRTQHKTLQARLSEDILRYDEASRFYRTGPGRFFVTDRKNDCSVPEDLRKVYVARRRVRSLTKTPALAVGNRYLEEIYKIIGSSHLPKKYIFNAPDLKYISPRYNNNNNYSFIIPFVCIRRGRKLLSYEVGKYRSVGLLSRPSRTIGFTTYVHADDDSLFFPGNLGIFHAGLSAAAHDLGIRFSSSLANWQTDNKNRYRLGGFIWQRDANPRCVIAIIIFDCPSDFEIHKKRLSINELKWIDIRRVADKTQDLDPWSQMALEMVSER